MSYKHTKRKRRSPQKALAAIRLVTFSIVLFILSGGLLFVVVDGRSSSVVENPILKLDPEVSTVKGSARFENEYLGFTVKGNWREVSDERVEGSYYKYAERSANGVGLRLIEVRVNSSSLEKVTYLLPVDLGPDQQLIPGAMSEHCSKSLVSSHTNMDPHEVSIMGVNLLCWTDNNQHIVGLGVKDAGGDTNMSLRRRDGSEARYSITYTDSQFQADNSAFIDIVASFTAR